MADQEKGGISALLEEALDKSGSQDRVAHLVLKQDWPVALCGASVSDHLGTGAPAMDRCVDCLRIATARGLGRPGWESRG